MRRITGIALVTAAGMAGVGVARIINNVPSLEDAYCTKIQGLPVIFNAQTGSVLAAQESPLSYLGHPGKHPGVIFTRDQEIRDGIAFELDQAKGVCTAGHLADTFGYETVKARYVPEAVATGVTAAAQGQLTFVGRAP